ncbi:translation release factor [Schizosaccharomyces cryophilus OY26]|uniref:Translation release factor n=1 Tax=Schizosaccharomyces cryophilus (strain OY26 / ATCC MYA-4695 / CBS 11777 / NBRC 106824 / NRRL Y48691) TaxID=653667 RepID=S9X8D3_SCHCR|nr:translation release factor [Schizosaccharomyces cryophilus OY26]EPY53362.1 translation release factor [Schizosaccharomyces cryophilus OY26]
MMANGIVWRSFQSRSLFHTYSLILFPKKQSRPEGFITKEQMSELASFLKQNWKPTKDQVEIKFARSSGPGGQNVNKLNTKVTVSLPLEHLRSVVPSFLLKHFYSCQELRRFRVDNQLQIQSQRTRTQSKNVQDALSRITNLLHEVAKSLYIAPTSPEKVQRITALKENAKNKRLQEKKKKSMKKSSRRISID